MADGRLHESRDVRRQEDRRLDPPGEERLHRKQLGEDLQKPMPVERVQVGDHEGAVQRQPVRPRLDLPISRRDVLADEPVDIVRIAIVVDDVGAVLADLRAEPADRGVAHEVDVDVRRDRRVSSGVVQVVHMRQPHRGSPEFRSAGYRVAAPEQERLAIGAQRPLGAPQGQPLRGGHIQRGGHVSSITGCNHRRLRRGWSRALAAGVENCNHPPTDCAARRLARPRFAGIQEREGLANARRAYTLKEDRMIKFALASVLMASAAMAVVLQGHAAAAPVDAQTLNRIADQGFNHGEVMDTAAHLADQIGGRMTNSPAMRKAEKWTQERFKAWGLSDVRTLPFDFGRGWWIESASVRMVEPRPLALRSIPIAWSPATKGAITAPIVVAPIRSPRDFAAWKGKLRGKIVLISAPTPPRDETAPAFTRLTDADIAKLNAYHQPSFDPATAAQRAERTGFRKQLDAFLAEEGAVASASISRSDGGLVHGEGSGYKVGQTPLVPSVEIAAEDYRRLARLAKVGEVKLEIDSKVHFDDSDHNAYDVLADIPGSDPKAGYVMAGAHLDSWVAGDGATDNGAGSAVVMEAARLLAALHVQPKRTIRFALWAGEEEGLLGSYAYVDKYLAHRPPADPKLADLGPFYASETYPIQPLPGFGDMDGYFNLDNGSGKIRGIFAEGNFAATPMLKEWLAPFASLGASTVVAETTGSTDHVFMVKMGLPAFQFIQDPLDYGSRTHHTDLDTYDHLRAEDLRQAAVVMAAVLLDAANAETPLPRNVMPTAPSATDPFKYPDPAAN